MRFAANDVADGASVNALDELDERRAIADLEADVEAELAFDALADFDDFLSAGHVNGNGLFEIDMLAACDDGVQMMGMVVRRRGHDDSVDFFGRRNLVVGIWTDEELRTIQGGIPFALLHLVKVGASSVELVLEEIGQRDDASPTGINEV